MHKFNHQSFDEYSNVVYPGTPFAGYHADLEDNANGQKRGFVLVEFDDKIKSVDFIEIENTKYEIIEVDANNRKAESVNQELSEKTADIDVVNKVVIVKIQGELMSGKTADIDVSIVRDNLNDKDALVVNVSKNQLTSKEYSITEAKGSNREEIEINVFSENIGQLKFDYPELLDKVGIKLASKLLQELGQSKLENENKNEYTPRIRNSALALLGLDDDS